MRASAMLGISMPTGLLLALQRRAAELTLAENRRVSVSEVVRRALEHYGVLVVELK